MTKKLITQERLKELFEYHPETGLFVRRVDRGKGKAGDIVGCINKTLGYVVIGIDYKHYYAHRLAVLYMTGEWPEEEVDHINRNRADNRWENLRCASRQLNAMNIDRKGFTFQRQLGKWVAYCAGKHVGVYETPQKARAAHVAAKSKAMQELLA